MQANPTIRSLSVIFIIYLAYLLILTLLPLKISLGTPPFLSSMYYSDRETLFSSPDYFAWDLIRNILGFIPFGLLVAVLWETSKGRWNYKIIFTTASGFMLSFIIEYCQFFVSRDPSLSDIFANTTGAITGALLAKYCYSQIAEIVQRYWSNIQRSRVLSTGIIMYGVGLFMFSNFPILHSDFRNWDPGFTFQLGNEATHDRPWWGKIYLVAIYRRPLHPEEIITNFNAGPFPDGLKNRIQEGLVALYGFNEGSGAVIYDISSFDSPLNLTIYDPAKIKWLTPNGIEILGNTIIKSQKTAEKLFYSHYSTDNSLSIEVWIAPGNLTQKGPARIVSFSRDPSFRNFTLAQDRQNIHFRIRTPISGLNGSKPCLITTDNFLTTGMHHIVATYTNGVEKLYINGIENYYTFSLGDASNHLLNIVGAGLVGKWVYCFLFFFPVGFLLYPIFFANHGNIIRATSLSAIAGFSILLVIEIFQVAKIPRPFDLNLLGAGIVITFGSALLGAILNNNDLYL